MEEQLTIIGAGRVASVLARFARTRGCVIQSVISLSGTSAAALGDRVGSLSAGDWKKTPPFADTILITVPDEAIPSVVSSLRDRLAKVVKVAHTSGRATSGLLQPLTDNGCVAFSFHPMQTFYSRDMPEALCAGIGVGIEGSAEGLAAARSLASRFGWRPIEIPAERKELYHAACVFASNFVTVLAASAADLLDRAAHLHSGDIQPILSLMRNAVIALGHAPPAEVLTGPAARGDASAIDAHMQALTETGDTEWKLYRECTAAAARLARDRGILNDDQYRIIDRILSQRSQEP